MITAEREDELYYWFLNESNDPASEEWRYELTDEEAELVARWDEQIETGLDMMRAKLGG